LVGGSGVKVGMRVASSDGTRIPETGWNGVAVGEASGGTVTITSVGGGAVTDACRLQAPDIQNKRSSANRREFFINGFVIAKQSQIE
jgi:hypothetical protein